MLVKKLKKIKLAPYIKLTKKEWNNLYNYLLNIKYLKYHSNDEVLEKLIKRLNSQLKYRKIIE